MKITSGRNPPDNGLTDAASQPIDGRSATPLVVGMVMLALAVVAYFALGMPGMDHTAVNNSHDRSRHTGHRIAAPDAFATALLNPATVAINVHVPADEVGIDGTDLTVPYDQLDSVTLPADRSTPIAVYCRSGTMSAIAAQQLTALGYTDVIELDGGTDAWTASGRAIAKSP